MTAIVERLEAHVARQIRIYPCHTNRASNIGASCLRQLIYYRVAWEQQIPPDVRLQMIFGEGNLQENAVVSLMTDAGFEVFEQQAAHHDKRANLSCHIDAKAIDPKGIVNNGEIFVVEIKSMSPYIFSTIENTDSFQSRPWLKKYPAQIQSYMFFEGIERGVMICKDKSTGEIKEVWFKLDIDYMDGILKKCEEINGVVAKWNGDAPEEKQEALLPPRIDDLEECKYCPFRLLCRPQIDFTAPLKIEDNPRAEQLIGRHEEIAETAREYGSLHKRLTDMLKQSAKVGGYDTYNALIGDWLVNGKADRAGKWKFVFTSASQGE